MAFEVSQRLVQSPAFLAAAHGGQEESWKAILVRLQGLE